MDDVVQPELAELRRRVYGPDGDLYGDPDAAARLSVLEARQAPNDEGVTGPDPTMHDSSDSVDAELSENTSRRSRLDKRTRILWVASVVITALITAAANSLLHASPGSQVASLPLHDWEGQESSTSQVDFPEGAVVTDDFHGLTVVYLHPDEASSVPDGGCLQVVPTVPDPGFSSTLGSFGCGAGPFAPTAALPIVPTSPRELVKAFPIGTTLQFVFEDGVIKVRSGGQSLVQPSITDLPGALG